jgi:hypothetical protein
MSDLATRLETATDPAELEDLGWEAARVLLGVETVDEARLRLTVNMRVIGNPARSSDACKRLQEIALPGETKWCRIHPEGGWVEVSYKRRRFIGNVDDGEHMEARAWLAAMLRAKGAK